MRRRPGDLVETLTSFVRTRYFPAPRSRVALEQLQEERIAALLAFVVPRSPYTRERFGALNGDLTRWRELVPTGKSDMMRNFSRLNTRGVDGEQATALALEAERTRDFSPRIADLTVGLSSGTSGRRALFLASQSENNRWAGVALAKLLPGAPWQRQRIALLHRANSHLYQGLGSGRLQFRYVGLLQPWQSVLDELRSYRPTVLIGPPSALRLLADARAAGELAELGPFQRIISVAEVLEPLDREHVERAFGVRVDIAYLANEGFIASSCSLGALHLHEERMVVDKEWLSYEDGTFCPVLTDLHRRVLPVIRHRLDDVLTLSRSPCPCGSKSEVLLSIQGRADDVFRFGERLMFPDLVRQALMHSHREIEEYEVVQRADDRVEATLWVSEQSSAQGDELAKRLEHHLGAACRRVGATPPTLHVVVRRDGRPQREGVKMRRIRRELST